jgi:hypothetical protein
MLPFHSELLLPSPVKEIYKKRPLQFLAVFPWYAGPKYTIVGRGFGGGPYP